MSRHDKTLSPEARRRLDELLADDALGNLDPADAAELRAAGVESNPFHTVVAALGEAIVPASSMPLALQQQIERDAEAALGGRIKSTPQAAPDAPRLNIMTWAGWGLAAAACVALGFALTREPPPPQVVIQEVVKEVPAPAPPVLSPAKARAKLLAAGAPLVKANWGNGNMLDIETVKGDIVWSPAGQSGFMRLANLPALPAGLQYQLWIIDAAREGENPVDGGVFDVTASGEIIIPFSAKLKVTRPVAFAITVEKAGGVVVSKQEKVAALAKPA